jgi:hypothetical protein
MFNEEKLDAIGARFEYSPWKHLRYCAHLTRVLNFRFQVCSISAKEHECMNLSILQIARELCIRRETISGICCDLCGVCLQCVDLQACWQCWLSETHEESTEKLFSLPMDQPNDSSSGSQTPFCTSTSFNFIIIS